MNKNIEKPLAEIGLFDIGTENRLILKHHFFSKSGEINVDRGDVNAIIQTVENIPRGIYTFISCREVMTSDGIKYRYYVFPRSTVQPIPRGVYIQAEKFYSEKIREWFGVYDAKAIEIIYPHHIDFYQLAKSPRLLFSGEENSL